ncbi:four helix bundle protein [Dulcicalothrix desertica PCC 7102]|uniref:Four helix bundle protein n=1 Tax=Dulcicalothrix desertica PCC 7102 TaxID=232991 RepID=A0A3S1CBR2_9CYAN|nr:four helix bundle protein [Dulcicalothrix desertica]RUT00370.1 four helix bundle protein [Dulcicalothrix desertica PCC 7102]TWH42476.1 four helix bundle protein [Dulcicalothrix desertica PCC 7102]
MSESIIGQKSFQFALEIIDLYSRLQEKREYVISKQLLRSGTSIGANVEEASGGQSTKDFLAKMYIAYKEARETKYWLRLMQKSQLVTIDVSNELQDADEIVRILSSIIKTTEEKLSKVRS